MSSPLQALWEANERERGSETNSMFWETIGTSDYRSEGSGFTLHLIHIQELQRDNPESSSSLLLMLRTKAGCLRRGFPEPYHYLLGGDNPHLGAKISQSLPPPRDSLSSSLTFP